MKCRSLATLGMTIIPALSLGAQNVRVDIPVVDAPYSLAHGLRGLGVEAGTVVAVMCRNHRYFVDATGACSKLGAHVLYLNTSFSVPQLREVLAREQAGALTRLADDYRLRRLACGEPS